MDEVKIYDAKDAIEALREVVKGREDFVYTESDDYINSGNACANWVQDSDGTWHSSCIVGHVFDRWGLKLSDAIKHRLRFEGVQTTATYASESFTLTEGAEGVLMYAQSAQDIIGKTWGEALICAERQYERQKHA